MPIKRSLKPFSEENQKIPHMKKHRKKSEIVERLVACKTIKCNQV